MGSVWTHAICDDCWDEDHPGQPSPRYGSGDAEKCCWCGEPTRSGIYLRQDPASLKCGGTTGPIHGAA